MVPASSTNATSPDKISLSIVAIIIMIMVIVIIIADGEISSVLFGRLKIRTKPGWLKLRK